VLVLKVTFRGSSLKEFAQHYLTDISPTGMFVRTQKPLPVGTKLRFELRLENDIPLLFGQGIVLWVSEENRELKIPCGMELRFDSLTPESENHFQWLQLEKRGVTVGTEVPLYIATSTTGSDPTEAAGKDSSDPARGTPTRGERAIANGTPVRGERAIANRTPARGERVIDGAPVRGNGSPRREPVGTGTLQGIHVPAEVRRVTPPTGPQPRVEARSPTGPLPRVEARSPTGPLPSVERSPTGPERALADTAPGLDGANGEGRETLPYLRREDEPGSRLPVVARRRPEAGLTGHRPPESLGPGDSDPGKMFHQRAASQSGSDLERVIGRDTLLTVQELAGRRRRLGLGAAAAVGLVGLIAFYLTRPSTPAPDAGSSSPSLPRLVRVASVPDKAEVLVDGKPAGSTPIELKLDGEPMLQIRHAGYLPEVVKISSLDPGWRPEGRAQVLELKITLSRAAASSPDARPGRAAVAPDAAPERRQRRPPEERKRRRELSPDEPRLERTKQEPEPKDAKKTEPEPAKKTEPEPAKKTEPEPAKKTEPEPAKKTEPEPGKPEPKPAPKKPEGVKTPDWASKPEAPAKEKPAPETKPEPPPAKDKKLPSWAD
jgi:uncharacterized protein (TIGR02266 family)